MFRRSIRVTRKAGTDGVATYINGKAINEKREREKSSRIESLRSRRALPESFIMERTLAR